MPHIYQLVMDCTTLHNQIRSFSSLFGYRYEDPYLVDANDKFSSDFISISTHYLISFVGVKFTIRNKEVM